MSNITIFCLTLDPEHENIIKKLSYTPVGLGNKRFSEKCFNDKTNKNISKKNSFYGEYTFHYWLWKNYLDKIKTDWVGFCQYRKFFLKEEININKLDFNILNNSIVKNISEDYRDYDCILGTKFSVENYKISKIFKNYLFTFLSDPKLLFNKKKRNLKLHFDLFHGKGNLDQAIELLEINEKIKFRNFMEINNAFNPHNMFMCKTKLLKKYYETIFPWLFKCENIFGFEELKGYGQKRIYGFLAERFLSYWFNENFKVKELPIIGKDISDYKNL